MGATIEVRGERPPDLSRKRAWGACADALQIATGTQQVVVAMLNEKSSRYLAEARA